MALRKRLVSAPPEIVEVRSISPAIPEISTIIGHVTENRQKPKAIGNV